MRGAAPESGGGALPSLRRGASAPFPLDARGVSNERVAGRGALPRAPERETASGIREGVLVGFVGERTGRP